MCSSSSPPFLSSSAVSPTTGRRRRSRFTYRHLAALAHCSPTSPLRSVAHIDLDAFYAQCETVRLGLEATQPLAVQQWQGLIAINYPARAFGLSRHVTVAEAKERCPGIVCVHVATWKEGEATWSYGEDATATAKEIGSRKVSLDPYRTESRKILALIKACLPREHQRVEKASIDEVFLDLSAQVHAALLERYPELAGPAPNDDLAEPLPRPPTTALDWAADALVDLDGSQSEEDDPDWDDVCMLVASEIVRDVRARVLAELHYTCSAGISCNKMLAKLGSGYRKPNSQTVIRNRAVQHFLSGFKFTKIRNLGGKLGDEIVAAFNTEMVSDLLPVPLEQLKKQFGDDTGSWLYGILRGEDTSEVNPRTQIKSMLSAKSFRPAVNSFDIACKWLRIFVADIFSRLVEEGVLENKRRPKTINLHHRHGGQTRSKQAPIPMGRQITEDSLYDLAKSLLAQVIVDGRVWPCANLSISVGGFEDGVTNNRDIGGFLVHGEEAKALRANHVVQHLNGRRPETPPPSKRRRMAERRGGGITRFFGAPAPARQDRAAHAGLSESEPAEPPDQEEEDAEEAKLFAARIGNEEQQERGREDRESDDDDDELPTGPSPPDPHMLPPSAQRARPPSCSPPLPPDPRQHFYPSANALRQGDTEQYICGRCSRSIPLDDKTEHDDFHFAQDLQDQPSSPPRPPPPPKPPYESTALQAAGRAGAAKSQERGRPSTTPSRPERGQRKLAFG